MNHSYQTKQPIVELETTCPFCHSLLSKMTQNSAMRCLTKSCRYNQFVIGNRIVHASRPELGIGKIYDLRKVKKGDKKNSKDWLFTQFRTNQQHSAEISSHDDKVKPTNFFYRYYANFSGYFDTPLFQYEFSHQIWKIGQKLKIQKTVGTIVGQDFHDSSGLLYYQVISDEGRSIRVCETEIDGTVDSPVDEFLKKNLSDPSTFLLKMWSHQINNLYSSNQLKVITNARLTLMPHQISVAAHLLDQGYARYILADEVGLGKTIEAGIYIKEMMARKLAKRILIVSPASIITQWEFEMENKFNLHFSRLSSKILKKSIINYQTGNLLHQKTGHELKLCSVTMQYARLERCAEILSKIEWDIVIFDEAHHLRRYLENKKTERYRTTLAYELAESLSARTKSLLLLTATPIQLHSFDLFSLIQLLNRFEFPNFDAFENERYKMRLLNLVVKNLYIFTRLNTYERNALIPQIQTFEPSLSESYLDSKLGTKSFRKELIHSLEKHHFLSRYVIRNRRRKVFPDQKIHRIPQIVEVELTQRELDTYNKIHQYLAKIYSENFTSGPAGMGFVMVILQKLLTSSVPAVLNTMRKRIRYLKENKDILEKLSMEQEQSREFTADESSLDVEYGLEEYDLEDRLVYHQRKKKMIKKKVKTLNINDHIKILSEFVQDLEHLSVDSKASRLLALIDEIYRYEPKAKILIFTQFKQTLFYLAQLVRDKGIQVAEFHGDLNENQKTSAVQEFRHQIPIMFSTEIGGEGRNFQFCHNIINYDLPWNPMRLEQRIGRLDRIGQTHNVHIYNFFIRDTVESSIVNAILDRIHLFEQSIGTLEPILGSLEEKIADLVLHESEDPLKFRLEDVITKTDRKMDEVYDQLEDFILDRRSFQSFNLDQEISTISAISDLDLYNYLKFLEKSLRTSTEIKEKYPDLAFKMNLLDISGEMGIFQFQSSEKFRQILQLPDRSYEGTFRLDLAQKQEEHDFFALGHPLLMEIASWASKDSFGGFSTILPINRQKWAANFLKPAAARLKEDEISLFKSILKNQDRLFLFYFEVEFIGVLVEKHVFPIIVTPDGRILKSPSAPFHWIHSLQGILDDSYLSGKNKKIVFDQTTDSHIVNIDDDISISVDQIHATVKRAQRELRSLIQHRAQQLIQLNKKQYIREVQKTKTTVDYQKKYAQVQLENARLSLRAKKMKLPSERQIANVSAIQDPHKKQARLQDFAKREQDVQYYQNEVRRWNEILESISFDLPAKLTRLEKFRKLWIDANILGFAILDLK